MEWGKVKQPCDFSGLTTESCTDKFVLPYLALWRAHRTLTNAGHERRKAPQVTALVAALAVALTACGGDPFAFPWSDVPDTAQIYSLARPELNIPSGFSFYDGIAFAIEAPIATGRWDVALDTQGGELVLLPPGALGIASRARIAAYPNTAYSDVTEAPSDTLLYERDDPVSVVAGTIYIIRTSLRPGSFGSSCSYYSKMEPIVINPTDGVLTFRYVTSPICNSRDLVPPE